MTLYCWDVIVLHNYSNCQLLNLFLCTELRQRVQRSTSIPTVRQLLLVTEDDGLIIKGTDVSFTAKVHKDRILWLHESSIQAIYLQNIN